MEHLFSYGTLRQPAVQRKIFGSRVPGTPGVLLGFRQTMVEITDPAVLALSGARHHPIVARTDDLEDRVEGSVLSLTPAQLLRADSYEVDDYVRQRVTLQSGRQAWLYVAKP